MTYKEEVKKLGLKILMTQEKFATLLGIFLLVLIDE